MQSATQLFALATLSFCMIRAQCELYTSVDEAAIWPRAMRQFTDFLNHVIELEERKLAHLKDVKESLTVVTHYGRHIEDVGADTTSMKNPINAFVILSRLRRAILSLSYWYDLVGDVDVRGHFDPHTLDFLTKDGHSENLNDFLAQLRDNLDIVEDFSGSSEALLRLQDFYDLKVDDFMNGMSSNLHKAIGAHGAEHFHATAYKMDAWDCFELGKTAYRDQNYRLAVQWLFKSLEIAVAKENELKQHQSNGTHFDGDRREFGLVLLNTLVDEILDYMAFAAYKLDLVSYAASLTEAWLERDPENERARENLGFYRNRLAGREDAHGFEIDEESDDELVDLESDSSSSSSKVEHNTPASEGELSRVVRNLCLQSETPPSSSGTCESNLIFTKDGKFHPGLKIEILYEDPRILRIHDIITDLEAEHFRNLALPNLDRATVSSRSGFRTSESRIAKAAWLPSFQDPLVARVEERLGSILGVSMHKAEHFQVVNYGLGGFYGPHMDSARSTQVESNASLPLKELNLRDRLATILIYLNHVEAGGSTVFPRLNLTVAPIERSAVVWFNLKTSGFSDERTMHSGCPVLLGSKWIATKWPREQSNSFIRPCKRDDAMKEVINETT